MSIMKIIISAMESLDWINDNGSGCPTFKIQEFLDWDISTQSEVNDLIGQDGDSQTC
jgi:hypothetical protein